MTDIILPVWTKKISDDIWPCFKSIVQHTKEFNLIVVGSGDSQVRNINKGLEKANSKYVCIVDWDIVVPNGWLEKLIQALDNDKSMGIVGPSMGGEYEKYFDGHIHKKDEVIDRGSVIGACMLFRNIGLKWDEKFLSGYWADTDFGRQYKEKGYKIGLHGGVQIKHAIHTTAGQNDYVKKMMDDGELTYFTKWGDIQI